MAVTFKNNRIEVETKLKELAQSTLYEVAGEMTSRVIRNQDKHRKTGQTSESWRYVVTEDGETTVAVIGSDYQNAIWEEFGTGEYALHGNGRKGGWAYEDEQGNWHRTMGKKPRRPFHKAYTALKNKIIKHIQDVFKGEF